MPASPAATVSCSKLPISAGCASPSWSALQWRQVIARDSGECQLEITGKGDKVRQVLLPAPIARQLLAARGDAPPEAPVFESTRKPGQPLTQRAVNYLLKRAAKRAGVNPAAQRALDAACARFARHR